MISFISIKFLLFVVVTIFLYFAFPIKWRWFVLLGASLYFYSCAGLFQLLFVFIAAGIAYSVACHIEEIYKSERPDKKRAKRFLVLGVSLLVFFLVYTKICNKLADALVTALSGEGIDFQVFVPLGISYYTFSLIGYMADVYWKKENAEHSYLRLLLYMIYFPHILQGPIPRHKRLASQLTEGHVFDYDSLCLGLQRMMWGYFKKMVIADRLAMLTREVFGNYTKYEGLIFVIAIFCSAIELYCDFSGGMDIVLGFSETLSIKLDENFKRPFFSKSVAEFWRRWHITLGTWFKDYVYMPLAIHPGLIKICQKIKNRFGNRAARNFITVISLATVWILTGLWHGTGWNYVIWGCYWGILIIFSTIFSPEIKKLTSRMKIDTKSGKYKIFQMIRTFLLFLISRLLVVPGNIRVSWKILCSMFSKWNPEIFINGTCYTIGLDRSDFMVGILALLILWGVEFRQERGVAIRIRIASYPLILRWIIYYMGILSILVFGIYSSNVVGDTFIYMNF